MQWLNDWIREIVLILLLATFIDLILPNSTFERYVKVVIGLMILLAVLAPIVSFLQLDWNQETMFSGIGEQEIPVMRDVADVLREGEEMRTYQEDQSLNFVQTQLSDMVTELVNQSYPNIVKRINVTLNEGAGETPMLEQMLVVLAADRVHLEPEERKDRHRGMAEPELIKPVEPIEIKVQTDEDTEKNERDSTFLQARHHEVRESIIKMIQAQYPWMTDHLTVRYDKEAMDG